MGAEQADAARRRSANEVDWDNIAEEIASLGRQEQWELYNRLVVLLTHLLKWQVQPGGRSASWGNTIEVQRRDLAKHLRKSPSLQSSQDREFAEAYASARLKASGETHLRLEQFPADPPFALAQAVDPEWPPGEAPHSSSIASNGS